MRVRPLSWLLVLLACAGSGTAAAQGARIHMHGEALYAADGVLYAPAGAVEAPALLVIPGAAGITPGVQAAAQAFLAAGYEVIVLDPNRSGPPGQASIGEADLWSDVQSAMSFIGTQPNLKAGRVAVLGLGRGARFALRLAREHRVKAVIVEGSQAPVAADLPAPAAAAALVELALLAGKSRPALAGAEVQVHALDAASQDEAVLFAAPDLARVRGEELAFLQRTLPAPK